MLLYLPISNIQRQPITLQQSKIKINKMYKCSYNKNIIFNIFVCRFDPGNLQNGSTNHDGTINYH